MSNARRNPGEGGREPKLTNNPMNQGAIVKRLANIRAAPRCGAMTRAGGSCQCPAIRARNRCRLHGGRSTGAPKAQSNGNFTTGEFTAEAIQVRRWMRTIARTYGKMGPS
jgi:hypothetical protein